MKTLLILGYEDYARPFLKDYNVDITHAENFTGKVTDYHAVVFTGGADITPMLYNHKRHPNTSYDYRRDMIEAEIIKHCFNLKVPTIGICRGVQFQCVMNGGWLIQHIFHHRPFHAITTNKGETIQVNSLHHQLCVPVGYYHLLAWHDNYRMRVRYEGETEDSLPMDHNYREPEALWYPNTRCLGVQYHPERMDEESQGYKYFLNLVKEYIGC